jgi:3-oxoacid CoA-transferase subunit A
MGKVKADAATALAGLLHDGMTISAGGFGLCGIPELLIAEISRSGIRDLTFYSNDGGTDDFGIGPLLASGRCRKLVASFIGSNPALAQLYLSGQVEIEFSPQGTLAERMRAGGSGIAGFYTRTGVGTAVALGKEHHDFDDETFILERGIVADLAIIKAWKADPSGNLIFRKTARNFNPAAAMCGKVCVAEVEEIVPLGALDPDAIHLPGIYVQHVLTGAHVKRIEHRTLRKAP